MEKTLKDLFVPYEIALLAKEKGLNKVCITRWGETSKKLYEAWRPMMNSAEDGEDFTSAPLYQQLFDWLEMRGYLIRKDHSATKYEVIDIDAGIILKSVSIEELNDLLAEVIEYTPRKEYITKYQTP